MNQICWHLMLILVALIPMAGAAQNETAVPHAVSFLELIANPDKFDGQLVSVTGFLGLDPPDGNMLYLHKEDYDNGILLNGIGVEVTKEMWNDREKLDGTYVQIVGIFQSGEKHGNRYSVIAKVRNCAFRSQPSNPVRGSLGKPHRPPPKPQS
jgi:hypothetical protein